MNDNTRAAREIAMEAGALLERARNVLRHDVGVAGDRHRLALEHSLDALAKLGGAFDLAIAEVERLQADSHPPFDFTHLVQRLEALERRPLPREPRFP